MICICLNSWIILNPKPYRLKNTFKCPLSGCVLKSQWSSDNIGKQPEFLDHCVFMDNVCGLRRLFWIVVTHSPSCLESWAALLVHWVLCQPFLTKACYTTGEKGLLLQKQLLIFSSSLFKNLFRSIWYFRLFTETWSQPPALAFASHFELFYFHLGYMALTSDFHEKAFVLYS